MRRAILLLTGILLQASALYADPGLAPVKNGDLAVNLPYTGELLSREGLCTATLVPQSRCVITAAHCVRNSNNLRFLLNGERSEVERVDVPRASGRKFADIALARLDRFPEITATPYSFASESLITGAQIIIAGFGETGGPDNIYYESLRQGSMSFAGYARAVPLGRRLKTDVLQLLPNSQQQALCSGDSGGPAFYKNTLVGINSAGVSMRPPAVACVRDGTLADVELMQKLAGASKRGRQRGCNRSLPGRFKSAGESCYDRKQQLFWSRVLPRQRMRAYLREIAALLGKGGYHSYDYDVAETYCALLNVPEQLPSLLTRFVGTKQSASYFRRFESLGGGLKGWRVPTEEELETVVDDFSSSYLPISSQRRIDSYWAQSKDPEYAPAISWRDGEKYWLPYTPSDCDLQIYSEAASVFHYRGWIDSTLQTLGCYE